MSWSVAANGEKEEVRKMISNQFDVSINTYKGTEEEQDVIAAKERVLSLIDAMVPDKPVKVLAYGSHSTVWSDPTTKKGLLEASMSIHVKSTE